MSQGRLGDANKFIAMYAAIVLQSIIDSYRHLSGKRIEGGVNRSTNGCGETRIQKDLATHHHEDPIGGRAMLSG